MSFFEKKIANHLKMDPLYSLLQLVNAGRWVCEQFSTIQENKGESKTLASRIDRLAGIANSLRTQLKPGNKQLSKEILDCLAQAEVFFEELEAMLQAHNGKTFSGGFLQKAKVAFAKTKEFFGAESFRDQLFSANNRLTQVLGDLETSIVAQGLMITVDIAEGVHRLEDVVSNDHREMKSMMQHMILHGAMASSSSAASSSIPVYKASDIQIVEKIDKGGNSHVFSVMYPDSIAPIVYKRCKSLADCLLVFAQDCLNQILQ